MTHSRQRVVLMVFVALLLIVLVVAGLN